MLEKTEAKVEEGGRGMRWLDSITVGLNGHELKQTPGHSERQGSLTCYHPWSHEQSI